MAFNLSPSYALGLLFIFLVSVIWSAASVLVQYIYTGHNFESPFLLTYIGTSLFVLWLPTHLLWERRHAWLLCWFSSESTTQQNEVEIIPWSSSSEYRTIGLTALTSSSEELCRVQDDNEDSNNETPEVRPRTQTRHEIWSHDKHIRVAMKIAPVWFISNWAYNASLEFTSITSSTVLASTGSLFSFLFAVGARDEAFTVLKLLGVLLGMSGSLLTALSDAKSNAPEDASLANVTISSTAGHSGTPNHIRDHGMDPLAGQALFGDFLGLVSAVGYGAYTVMIRVMCPRDERTMSMQLLLGYIGLFNAVLLSPIAISILIYTPSKSLTWIVLAFLVVKGLFDNVLSDYLWARAVVLTTATVATVGLGLTIPLAFVSDWLTGHADVISAASVFGALAVLGGFVAVNIGNKEECDDASLPREGCEEEGPVRRDAEVI